MSLVVHANLVCVSHVDTNDRESEEEYAQFLLQVKDDPSYRRGQSLQTILGRSAGSCLRVL